MTKHVFLSYLRENKTQVDELQSVLEAAGFAVWRDTDQLWAGDNWQQKIREAVQGGSLVFLACFSGDLEKRDTSYQYAELVLAADEYRIRPLDTNWLMTVRFDECAIPPVDLGMGRTLERTINRIDLFGPGKTSQYARLIQSINRVMDSSPGASSATVSRVVTESKRADSGLTELRDLLRNPHLIMDYDEYLIELRKPILTTLADRDRFPTEASIRSISPEEAIGWADRINNYEEVIADAIEPVKLITMYGQAGHAPGLSQFMRAIGRECIQTSGVEFYTAAHEYPALVLTYTVAIAAVAKRSFPMLNAGVAQASVVDQHRVAAPFIARSGQGSVSGNWGAVASLLNRRDSAEEVTTDLVTALLTGKVGRRHTPISDHLFTFLAPVFTDHFGSDEEYADAFDRAEVYLDLIAADAKLTIENFWGGNGGYGRYTWRNRHTPLPIEHAMFAELTEAQDGWTPLMGGICGGDTSRATAAFDHVTDIAAHVRKQQW